MTTTMTLQDVAQQLGITDPWVETGGVNWLAAGAKPVRELTKAMNALHARFVTITAYELPKNEGFRLEYHWDHEGQLLGFPYLLAASSIESIYDICEAADWIEREIHEGFGIDFTGREYEPLLLRQGDTMGVNLRDVPAAAKETK